MAVLGNHLERQVLPADTYQSNRLQVRSFLFFLTPNDDSFNSEFDVQDAVIISFFEEAWTFFFFCRCSSYISDFKPKACLTGIRKFLVEPERSRDV